jgi:hypothetical protein
MARLVRHSAEMKLGAGADAIAEKAVENGRRRRSVEASVMKAQSNLNPIRHS